MAQSRDVAENPVTGERFEFLLTETPDDISRIYYTLRPGGSVPIAHIHPKQQERFRVTHGVLAFRVGRATGTLQAGGELTAEPGVRHIVWNPGPAETKGLIEFRPALQSVQMLSTVCSLANSGRAFTRGPLAGLPRNPLLMASLSREFRAEFRPAALTLRILSTLAQPIGWAYGIVGRRRAGRGAR